jgi:Rieske Fe-S protein
MKRRSFFKWLFSSVTALWVLGFGWLTAKFLRPPEITSAGETSMIRVGPLDSLEVGSARFFPHARQPVWVMRLPSDEVVAVSAICTHFHCIVKWEDGAKVFRCPCHQSSFDQYGNVLSGPPPAPLPKLAVELRRGEVYVRIS